MTNLFIPDLAVSYQAPAYTLGGGFSQNHQFAISPDLVLRLRNDSKRPTTLNISPEGKYTVVSPALLSTTTLNPNSVFTLADQIPGIPNKNDPRASIVKDGTATTEQTGVLQLDLTVDGRQRIATFLESGTIVLGFWLALGGLYTFTSTKVDVFRVPPKSSTGDPNAPAPDPTTSGLLATSGQVNTSSWSLYARGYFYGGVKYGFNIQGIKDRLTVQALAGYLWQPSSPPNPIKPTNPAFEGPNLVTHNYRVRIPIEYKITPDLSATLLFRLTGSKEGPVADAEAGLVYYFGSKSF